MAEAFPRAFGPYVLLARLGQGAAGSAYLARPLEGTTGVPSPLVLKCLHQRLHGNEEYVRRFRHEAELAVRVDSPSVARVYDVGAVGDQLYIALEYVAGWTLGRVLSAMAAANKTCPPGIARAMANGTLAGLGVLHDAKDPTGKALEIVHRDVSPKNVMVGDDGLVRIIDLGLGKSKVQDWKTAVGRVMGSPGYMPLEQVSGETVDLRVDLYAVAVILWELLTCERYIKPDQSVNMIREALTKDFVAPSTKNPSVTPAIDELLRRAMAQKPARRFSTAGELAAAIGATIPENADARAVTAFVDGFLDADKKARVNEVARLIALPFNDEDAEPELMRTEIWVRREGVSDMGERTRSRRRPGPEGDSVAFLPTEIKTQTGSVSATRVTSPRVEAMPSAAAPTVPARPLETPMATPSGVPVFRVVAPSRAPIAMAVLLALGVGVLVGVMITAPTDGLDEERRLRAEEPPMRVVEPPPSAPVAETPPPSAPVAEANEPDVENGASEPPSAAADPQRPRRPKVQRDPGNTERPPAPPPAPPPPSADPKQDIVTLSQRLTQRVVTLKEKSADDPNMVRSCDKLLARLAMARVSKDQASALAQLKDLERELAALANK